MKNIFMAMILALVSFSANADQNQYELEIKACQQGAAIVMTHIQNYQNEVGRGKNVNFNQIREEYIRSTVVKLKNSNKQISSEDQREVLNYFGALEARSSKWINEDRMRLFGEPVSQARLFLNECFIVIDKEKKEGKF